MNITLEREDGERKKERTKERKKKIERELCK